MQYCAMLVKLALQVGNRNLLNWNVFVDRESRSDSSGLANDHVLRLHANRCEGNVRG